MRLRATLTRLHQLTLDNVELLAQLEAALHERFAVQREAGEGGMAYVFEALDLKHDRKVAIKVLKPEIASGIGSDRFLREIRIVARLSHPNVMPLYESGEVDDLLYYVMPFVTGESLRDRMAREPRLTMSEVLDIVRDVSKALACAHEQGVIHRDLKPANVMLSGGVAVVTDFGIAHALDFAGSEQLTHTGLAVGTPTYMSPEQASGEVVVDARSDIYSLGCVVHEMLTGAPPYRGGSALAVLARHASEPVPDIQSTHPDVPEGLALAVAKSLSKDRNARFSSIEQFQRALEGGATSPGLAVPARSSTRSRTRMAIFAIPVILAAGVGGWLISRGGATPAPKRTTPLMAVLAFEHQGPADEKYFTDGITEEISNRISEVDGIGVVSRTSSMQFDLRNNTLKDVADKLKIDYVLIGSIRTDRRPDGTNRVLVSPKLVNVASGLEIWKSDFTRDLVPGEIFEVQGMIAREVANALNVALSPEAIEALAARPTTEMAAYNSYLRGILHASQFLVLAQQLKAIEMFENAVRLDPQFALAHARLAQTHALYYAVFDRTPERLRKWELALNRATALAPSLPQTRLARGQWYFYAKQEADSALAEIAALRQSQPNNTELIWLLGRVQRTRGDFPSALASFNQVSALDPRSAIFPFEAATVLWMMRRYEEGRAAIDRSAALAPDWLPAKVGVAQMLFFEGKTAQAAQALPTTPELIRQLVPHLISDPLYRNLWEIVIPEPYQEGLAKLSLRDVPTDSAEYYRAKGRLFARRGDGALERAYFDSARTVLEQRRAHGTSSVFLDVDLGTAYAVIGRTAEARAHADTAARAGLVRRDAFRGWFAALDLAHLYARLGLTEECIAVLESLRAPGGARPMPFLQSDPAFVVLRNDPRFQTLVRGG